MSRYDGASPVQLFRGDPSKRPIYCIIDDEDFARVTRSTWRLTRDGYVRATSKKHLAAHHMALHAYILRVQPGEMVDHINGDKLDNRKANLRIVTATHNAQNAKRPTIPDKTSRFKGVSFSGGKWRAAIQASGATHYLGAFEHEEDAARAYDAAAIRLHGDFARTNATMKLFEQADPFVPNCKSGGSSTYTKRNRRKKWLNAPMSADLVPKTYEQRMDDRLRAEFGL